MFLVFVHQYMEIQIFFNSNVDLNTCASIVNSYRG